MHRAFIEWFITANFTMFKSGLTAIRQSEHLVLNTEPNVYVNGEIAQYLLNHQINGIRFLYRNYRKRCSSILNDESGSGKCFQCVALFDAIFRTDKSIRILIICHRKQSLEHWQFHVDSFLKDMRVNVADHEGDTQNSLNAITIASVDYVLKNLSKFTMRTFDCIVLQDQHFELTSEALVQLKDISSSHKIVLCSNDLMSDLAYFYELLKFCELKAPLKQSNNSNNILSLEEFKLKFGCNDDKSISKRNQAFRQCNLLNTCTDFYQRRVCSQLGSQFPPISSEDFRSNFDAWKTYNADTEPMKSNATDEEDSLPIELLPAPVNRSLNSTNNEEVSILNVACTDFSDFETQMSPLIYSDSEDSLSSEQQHDKTSDINIENSQIDNSQRLTPEIVCNQEHAAKIVCDKERSLTKEPVQSTSKSHPTSPIKRISPGKRLNYRQLPIEIKSNRNGRNNPESKTYLFRTKKQPCQPTQVEETDSQKVIKHSENLRHRSTSSTSDIQIISQKCERSSPIVISTSSEDQLLAENEPNNPNESQLNRDTFCQSPDLFTSFMSMKSETLSQQLANSQSSTSKKPDESEVKTFRDVFGAPDECDDIDLLSNTNADIFEITKNSVFDHVLCSASDRITPLKSIKSADENKSTPSMSCLSGLRIILPKLDGNQVQRAQDNEKSQRKIESQSSQQSTDSVVDLTLNESQKIIEISSEDSVRDVEKTPERKRELTPSTRSCLKRQSSEATKTDEKRGKSSGSRLVGWLSTTRTSPRGCDTPQSRRRFDKWKHRTDINNMKTEDNLKLSRPRNLFQEFKSKSKPSTKNRREIPSTSTAESPSIFSDND